jgi:putative tricarboxylic transport membrane protein
MISNPGSILGQVESGDMRPLISTADERLEALPDVPTDQELGFEGIPSMPRGLILPPDAPAEAQEWWIETMKEVVETEEWQAYLDENYLTEDVRWGEDFGDFLTETQQQFKDILTEHGAL